MNKKACLLYTFILLSIASFSQDGNYYTTNFPLSTYGASPQNWCITQDSLQRIYVANQSGVLIYDGETWNTINLNDGKGAKSITSSVDGKTIYVGGEDEFGYIKFLRSGEPRYISLSSTLSDKGKEMGQVWAIKCINENVFFCCNHKITWFSNNKFKKSFIPTGEKFHTFFEIENTLVIREAGIGLDYLKNDVLEEIPNTSCLAAIKVRAVIPRINHTYWLCTDKGLYLLSFDINHPGHSYCSKQNLVVNDWMIENDIYCGLGINRNLYALGSLKNGVLLVDSSFNTINHIDNEISGLQDNCTNFIYKDLSGNLWLALNNGLSYIEINTPITSWIKSNGVKGSIQSIAKYDGIMYIATDKGIEKLNSETNTFQSTEIDEESWDICNTPNGLLAGTSSGLYFINMKGSKKLFNNDGVHKIFIDTIHGNSVFLLGVNTLLKGTIKDNTFHTIKSYNAPDIASVAEDSRGNIYFGTVHAAAIIYLLNPAMSDTLFQLNNVPHTTELNVFSYAGRVLAATDRGIFSSDGTNKFNSTSQYNILSPTAQVLRGIQYGKDIWLAVSTLNNENVRTDEITVMKHTNTGFIEDHKLLKHIKGITPTCFFIDSSKIFIGTNDNLIEYNTAVKNVNAPFNTFISKITHKIDTNIICQNISSATNSSDTSFAFRNNELYFFAAASDYYDKTELEFSWYLEGQETIYGNWTKDNRIHYNNLHEGSYSLNIKSRDIFGKESAPIIYSFNILPPWYRTWWMYGSYGVIAFFLLFGIFRWRTASLRKEKDMLEQTVQERTVEVVKQKDEAEKQKALVEEKQKEILDSIHYAKRIQNALLASDDLLNKNLQEYFVFFKPKDIVSGDFYWAIDRGNKFYLAVCDSTGHGVPGAFMSLLNISFLNDGIAERNIINPNEVFNHARKKLLENMEGQQDGMDGVLLCFEEGKELKIATAYNSPIIIQNGKAIELPADKIPVGSSPKENESFTHQTIALQKGDMIYAFTDGYADQFGGPKGKKFKHKQLLELMLSIADKNIEEQKDKLGITFNDWKGDLEQVDDVLVIGIRV